MAEQQSPKRQGANRWPAAFLAVLTSIGTALSAAAGYAGAPTWEQFAALLGASGLAGACVAITASAGTSQKKAIGCHLEARFSKR